MACELQFQISQNDQRGQLCPELRWKWDTPIPNDNIQSTAKATSNLESIDQCWSEIHCIALLPWIMVFRMQMQSLMFFFWGGDFHASVLSFLEPATSACSWHVKMHSSSKLIGTTSETIRNPAEPHRADNYWILLITGSWYFRMVHAANGTPRKPTSSTFFAVMLHRRDLHKENVVTCYARPCQTQAWLMHNPTVLACTDCLRSPRK